MPMTTEATAPPAALGLTATQDPWWTSGYTIRWTWPVDDCLRHGAYTSVAEIYRSWGVAEEPADLLGELAADYTGDVLKLAATTRYMAVTATLDDCTATVSAIPAPGPAPLHSALVPLCRGARPIPSTWGRADLAAGPCLYASINLINVVPPDSAPAFP